MRNITPICLFFCFSGLLTLPMESQTVSGISPNPVKLQILDSHKVKLAKHSVIYNRVKTPALKPQNNALLLKSADLPDADSGTMENPLDKHEAFIHICAIVYDQRVTEVRWTDEKGEYVIWSDINFNSLRGLDHLETAGKRYDWILSVDNIASADMQRWNAYVDQENLPSEDKVQIPTLANVTSTPSCPWKYKIVSSPQNGSISTIAEAMDELHRFFYANKSELARQSREWEAARIAQEKWRNEHPPVQPDTVINFFPIKSVLTGKNALKPKP